MNVLVQKSHKYYNARPIEDRIMEEFLELFAETEVFIYVFAEIISKIRPFQNVIFKKASITDTFIYIVVFGGFSIFGNYHGIHLDSGAISNIRDLAPMLAGVTAGPVVGLATGLMGGIHRLFMGGITNVACAVSTVVAGVIGGMVYLWKGKKLISILQGMLLAVFVELLHGGIVLLIARPFAVVWEIVKVAIPSMMIADALGMAIGIIIISHTRESEQPS